MMFRFYWFRENRTLLKFEILHDIGEVVMKYQRSISLVLIVSGLYLILRSTGQLFVTGHTHAPGAFLYSSQMLEAEMAGDQTKLDHLKHERDMAKQHIQDILDYSDGSAGRLFIIALINLYCGCVMLPDRKSQMVPSHDPKKKGP